MNRNQYNLFLRDLIDVVEKHGFHSRAVNVQGQKAVEDKILFQKQNPYLYFDVTTYSSMPIFEEFKETRCLKTVWAKTSRAVREYQLDPCEVVKIAPDYCPITGALIDYGYGFNQVTNNAYFRPGIDHIIAVNNGGAKFKDISNIQIISQYINTVKSHGTIIDALKWTCFELEKIK